jgi:hypothetical protein
MPQYRKKPVVIDAVQWLGVGVAGPCPKWLAEALDNTPDEPGGVMRMGNEVHIGTLEGVMVAKPDDWIIKGIKGELYPCKPDIFEATYEPVHANHGAGR